MTYLQLFEARAFADKAKVDRENNVIRGVKILSVGEGSSGVYENDVVRAAAPLYENAKCNVNHMKGDAPFRSFESRMGRIKNVSFVENSGLYGDLNYNPKHPLAEMLVHFAENDPGAIGLSHYAQGPKSLKNGKSVVESIKKVHSVDLVADPGSTAGLYESALAFEEGELADRVAADVVMDRIRQLNRTAMSMISDCMWSEQMTPAAKQQKILGYVAEWFSELSKVSTVPVAEGASNVELKDLTIEELKKARPDLVESVLADSESAKKSESVLAENKKLAAELDALKARDALAAKKAAAVELCEAAKLPKELVTEVFVETLVAAKDDAAMKLLVDDRKLLARGESPKSKEQGLTEGAVVTDEKTLEEAAAAFRG